MKSFLTKSLFAIAMLGAISAASPSLAASYRKVTIAVPDAPIDEALPARMTFYVDTRFTTAERNRFVSTVQTILGIWAGYYRSIDQGATPALKRCTSRYARF